MVRIPTSPVDDDALPDVQLDQAADIVTDLAELRQVPPPPARTARVNP